jgi:hypothetical protein
MGRPVKKSRLSTNDTGPAGIAGTIEVSNYKDAGGSLHTNDGSYIQAQRSSRKFKIHQKSDSSSVVALLVPVAGSSLAAGQFNVHVTLPNGDVAYVSKLYDRTVHYVKADGVTTGSLPYTLGVAAHDDSSVAGQAVLEVI